ncbi:MAG: Rrf2 family transcriptional regulator [Campylobacterales bacterium]|nr:Rrf2 family transcriptional regulator [Campylobacterales bacterium]
MLITRASEYAILSLIIIAQKNEPTDVETLSNELCISKSFLAKILQNLAKENILKSFKGANGGFVLNMEAENITLLKIVSSAENKPVSVFECSSNPTHCHSNKSTSCIIFPYLSKLQTKINEHLNSITLKGIIEG